MTEQQAMRLALEALEEINKLSVGENAIFLPAEIDGAMEALRQALEQQPADEPVAWMLGDKLYNTQQFYFMGGAYPNQIPLYTRPQPAAWVGLTEQDWKRNKHSYDFQKGVDWAEAALRSKNT